MTSHGRKSNDHPDRRTLLCGGCASLLTACGPAVIGIPDGKKRGKPKDTGTPTPDTATIDTGTIDTGTLPITHPLENPDYPCNQPITPGGEGWRALTFDEFPMLREVGGVAATSDGNGFLYSVIHVQEGCYICIARRCSHVEIIIDYDHDLAAMVCPAHGAMFGWDGAVVQGPATEPIQVFFAGLDGETVWVFVPPQD